MNDSRSLSWSALALVVAASGCGASAHYAYVPEQPSVVEDGVPASIYPVPPERPEGEIRIASQGLAELKVGTTRGHTLHVRVVVANHGDSRAWRFDPHQQVAVFPDDERTRPILADSEGEQVPAVVVKPGERRTVDLYFAVPDDISDDGELPAFDVLWRVQTSSRVVSQRTRFERIDTTPEKTFMADEVYYGTWSYDPFYPSHAVSHTPSATLRESPNPVTDQRHGLRYRRSN